MCVGFFFNNFFLALRRWSLLLWPSALVVTYFDVWAFLSLNVVFFAVDSRMLARPVRRTSYCIAGWRLRGAGVRARVPGSCLPTLADFIIIIITIIISCIYNAPNDAL